MANMPNPFDVQKDAGEGSYLPPLVESGAALGATAAQPASANTFTVGPQQIAYTTGGATFGIGNNSLYSAPSSRAPFRSNLAVSSSATANENFVIHSFNAFANGDYTSPSPAPTDPGYLWCYDFFGATGNGSADGNGLAVLTGSLLEMAVRSGSGTTIGTVVGASAQAYFFSGSTAKATNMASFTVLAPANLGGASGVATNAYGLYLNAVYAGAAGSTSGYTMFSTGGVHKLTGEVQIWNDPTITGAEFVIKTTGGGTGFSADHSGNVTGSIISMNSEASDVSAPAATAAFFSRTNATRVRPKFVGPTGASAMLGEAQWDRSWQLGTPNGTAFKWSGTTGGGATTGTGTVVAQTSAAPVTVNFATAASVNSLADVSTSSTGSMACFIGANTDKYAGFDFHGYASFPDASYNNTGASTGSRIFAGMVSTVASVFNSDRGGANSVIAFCRSNVNGGATDSDIQFVTNSGSASTVADTGMAFTVGDLYHFHIWCPAGSATIYWQVDDITAGTSETGSATATLPATTTALFSVMGVSTVDATARNFRATRLWLTTDVG